MSLTTKDITAFTLIASVKDLDLKTRRRLMKPMTPLARQIANGLKRRSSSPRVRKAVALLKRAATKTLPNPPIFDRVYAP